MDIVVLNKQREHFYAKRKSLFFKLNPSNKVKVPDWVKTTPYAFIYQDYRDLLLNGTVVWSYLVQANGRLFKAGAYDHPAVVLYGINNNSNDLLVLQGYAEYFQELLKDDDNPAEEKTQRFVDALIGEGPLFNKKLPSVLTDDYKVCFTSIVVHRKSLPDGFINNGWFPLISNPAKTNANILLPHKYWLPEVLRKYKAYREEL